MCCEEFLEVPDMCVSTGRLTLYLKEQNGQLYNWCSSERIPVSGLQLNYSHINERWRFITDTTEQVMNYTPVSEDTQKVWVIWLHSWILVEVSIIRRWLMLTCLCPVWWLDHHTSQTNPHGERHSNCHCHRTASFSPPLHYSWTFWEWKKN